MNDYLNMVAIAHGSVYAFPGASVEPWKRAEAYVGFDVVLQLVLDGTV